MEFESRGASVLRWRGGFDVQTSVEGRARNGVALNQLYDQAEQDVLELYFRGSDATTPPPSGFHLALLAETYVIDETDTMTEIAAAELDDSTSGGYGTTEARKAVPRSSVGWPSSLLVAGNRRLTSLQVLWTATTRWEVRAGFVAVIAGGTAARGDTTGRIVAVAPLDPIVQLRAVNDTIRLSYNLSLA